MEKKKTIFDYAAQVLTVFGFTMLTLNLFCRMFGDSAQGFSAIFELGSQGISTPIAFQFLCISALIVGSRFVFFTDMFIKKMAIWLRTVCLLTMAIFVIVIFIIVFRWFPVNRWQPWALFFGCFVICFIGSYLVMSLKEKLENKQLEEALQRLKESGEA